LILCEALRANPLAAPGASAVLDGPGASSPGKQGLSGSSLHGRLSLDNRRVTVAFNIYY